ncbi:MAG: helix-turn-helix domain-containing GNAT family N-acetyltransferase [Bdellovibrionales bacterium]|nr:helix-turn-helix domain-containing GNAT family N-acetyltransferase [Bdellovibrionales bacterium]
MANPLPDLDPELEQRIEQIRRFNRIYVQRIGVLAEKIYGSSYSLAEVRVLNEISLRKTVTASVLCREMRMDGGYISRILQGFEREGLITKERSKRDGRQRTIQLTRKGWGVAESISTEARHQLREMLVPLSAEDQARLVDAMGTIRDILGMDLPLPEVEAAPWTLRPHRPGDMGLIVHSHAVEFARDYGWNEEFEALVAEKTAEFIRNFDPACERLWLAEQQGRMVGSLCLVKLDDIVAELRLPFVASEARNMGIGKGMLAEAIRFARHVGYEKITMWTESVHDHARDMFEDAGFRVVEEKPHHRFGRELVGQRWEMLL